MKSRTCPNCGHKYSLLEYWKVLLTFRDSQFDCYNCDSKLSFTFGRRILVAFIAMLPLLTSSTVSGYFSNTFEISLLAGYLLFILVFLIWVMLIYGFDSFKMKS